MSIYNVELKPCPFCDATHINLIQLQDEYNHSHQGWYVSCPRCMCRGPQTYKGYEHAAKLWNRSEEK